MVLLVRCAGKVEDRREKEQQSHNVSWDAAEFNPNKAKDFCFHAEARLVLKMHSIPNGP